MLFRSLHRITKDGGPEETIIRSSLCQLVIANQAFGDDLHASLLVDEFDQVFVEHDNVEGL